MDYPKISVIVPIYNVESYLHECINSIINQTYKNLEIILVDDGSPDNCPLICDKYAELDSRIIVIHKENGGLSDARNAGLDISTGELISFIDSDDFIDKEMYERLVYIQKTHNSDIVRCDFKPCGSSNKKHSIFHLRKEKNYYNLDALKALLSYKFSCASWDKLYKRDCIGGLRFKKDRNNEDMLFLFYLLQNVSIVSETNKVFYNYRIRENSISRGNKNILCDIYKNYYTLEKEVISKRLPLTKEINTYKIITFISICRAYITNKNLKKDDLYFDSVKYIKDNIVKIIFCNGLRTRFKLWGLICVLKN